VERLSDERDRQPPSDRPRKTAAPAPLNRVLALQRSAGNQAVANLLQREPTAATSPPVTAKAPDSMDQNAIDQEIKALRGWLGGHDSDSESEIAKKRLDLLERELLIRGSLKTGSTSVLPHSLAPGATDALGQFSPFARPPTEREWGMIQGGRAVHYTAAENAPKIAGPNGTVIVKPSAGVFKNLTVPRAQESGYYFLGEPGSAAFSTNLAGRGSKESQAFVVVEGVDLPPTTLFRPLDQVIVVPGEYGGPGTVVPAGGKMPAASRLPTTVVPKDGRPVSEPGIGKVGGATVALAVVSGIVHQGAMDEQRQNEGYAPAGPAQGADHGTIWKIGRWLIDPFLDSQSPAATRFDVVAWRANARRTTSAKKVGDTVSFGWQIHKQGLLGQSIEDVEVLYEKLPDGTWRPDKKTLDGRHHTPDLNLIIGPASDARVELELDFTDGA
jgi:hypothetical protein